MSKIFSYHNIVQPVIGLAPMDGVTDRAYREIQKKYGSLDIMFSEFTNVTGLCKGASALFRDLSFSVVERPIIAQLFGNEPDHFRMAVKIVMDLGFDGVDINMGCPARKVTDRGSGAGLIKNPKLALEIIRSTRKGIEEYIEENGNISKDGRALPDFTLSVKTRIGYDSNTVEEWIGILNTEKLDWISVHGRTFKQMYTGRADRDALASAVATSIAPVLVNGDIYTAKDGTDLLTYTQASGILIGRGSFGDPWLSKNIKGRIDGKEEYIPTLLDKLEVMLEHTKLHVRYKGERNFIQMRKNFGWYIKNIDRASKYRIMLMQTENITEVEDIISQIRNTHDI